MFLAFFSAQNPPQPLPALSSFPWSCSSGESLKTYWRSWWALGSRGARYLESNAREVTVIICCPQQVKGTAQRGGRAQDAAELYQAWKPGLPLRTVLGSGSNAGQWLSRSSRTLGKVMQQLQIFRRRESSEFFPEKFHFHCSTTIPARRHKVNSLAAVSKDRKEGGLLHTCRRVF